MERLSDAANDDQHDIAHQQELDAPTAPVPKLLAHRPGLSSPLVIGRRAQVGGRNRA